MIPLSVGVIPGFVIPSVAQSFAQAVAKASGVDAALGAALAVSAAAVELDEELEQAAKRMENVAAAARSHPDMEPKELEQLVGEYVFNVVKGTSQFQVTEPLEVMEIGTGFMLVKREVFEKMEVEYPSIKYKPDHVGQANFDGTRYIHAYFDTVIDTKDSITGGGSERYLSEDYMFCQMWRKMGGTIYLCPWMKTQHIGTYAFSGNMPAVAQYTGKL